MTTMLSLLASLSFIYSFQQQNLERFHIVDISSKVSSTSLSRCDYHLSLSDYDSLQTNFSLGVNHETPDEPKPGAHLSVVPSHAKLVIDNLPSHVTCQDDQLAFLLGLF